MRKRLSICYAVPGHYLLPEVGPSRNVLSVAEALSKLADVTVAFRKVVGPVDSAPYRLVELDPKASLSSVLVDDSAVRGTSLADLLRYLLALRKFSNCHRADFDVVLEKSWLLSGYLAHGFRRHGVPGVLVENLVRVYDGSLYGDKSLYRYIRHSLSQAVVRHYVRKTSAIVAETKELKDAITERWGIPEGHVEIVGLGVDSRLFHPIDQQSARCALEIDANVTVLLYVGVLDSCHNLKPVVEALNHLRQPDLQLHVVGDGLLRSSLQETARTGNGSVFFHGRVPHEKVPQFIAAADLCLAPYEPQAFINGKVSFATLKILEYLACARPVVSVPSGHILNLVQPGVNGFLFSNETSSWIAFLRDLPAREKFREIGSTGARVVCNFTWEKTAAGYMGLCQRMLQNHPTQ